jgi:hypothetical protein
MNTPSTDNTQRQQADAAVYALLLDWGTHLGALVLVLSFAAYVFDFLEPLVPLDQLPSLWNQPVATYLAKTGTPTGWGWLVLAGKGDMASLASIALLVGSSLPPLLGLIFLYLKRGDHAFVIICCGIVLVLVLAASSLLTGGN